MAFNSLFENSQKNRRIISAISLVIILLITVLLILFTGEPEKIPSVIPRGFIVFAALLFVVVNAYFLLPLWIGEEKQNSLNCVVHGVFETKIVGFFSVLVISKLTHTMFFPYVTDTGIPIYFLPYFAMGIHLLLSVISCIVGCSKFFKAYTISVLVCLFGFCVGRLTKNLNIAHEIVYYVTIFANICVFFYVAYDLSVKRSIVGCGTFLRDNWKNIVACLVAVGFGTVIEVVRAANAGEEVSWMKALFFSAFCLCVTECACLYHKKEKFVERAALCILLISGITMAIVLPFSTLIAWDDETHFHNVIQLVQGMNWTEADASMTYREFWSRGGDTASFSQLADYFVALNERGKIVYFEPFTTYFVDMHQAIAYIPHCIGMWIGQVLNLQFGYVFYAGRIASAVFYALIIYAAMKRLNGGKLLVAAIALLPTNLFQATNYSYDPWLVCLAIYSVALYIGYLQEEDKLLDVKEALYVTSVMMLAIAPKGVYFPLLALFLFAPNIKFMNAKQHKRYLLSVIAMIVLCFSVYMLLPFLGGSHSGDTRFGSEISSSGQILYILTNPMAYLKTFWGFFKEYVSLSGSFGWTSFMAYLGGKDFHVILCMILIFVALLDRGEKDRVYNTLWCKAGGLFASFTAAAVVVTIMYCACSPVGADYIDGCQPRYLAPIIFPVLIMCVNFGYFVPKNRERFSAVFLALSGYVASAAIWFNIICRYVP